jgi:hypothetical protein
MIEPRYVPVMRVTNLSKIIDELKDNGYWVAGAEADNATDYIFNQSTHTLSFTTNYDSQWHISSHIAIICSIIRFSACYPISITLKDVLLRSHKLLQKRQQVRFSMSQ